MIDNPCAVVGVNELLSKFMDHEIFALCATVTQGLLKNKLQTREEAIKAVLAYSQDAESLLRRKLFTRNHLFEYLHKAGISVTGTMKGITKDELVDSILKAWWADMMISKFVETPGESSVMSNLQQSTSAVKVKQEEPSID